MDIEFNILSIILLFSSMVMLGVSSIVFYRYTDSVRWFTFTMLAVTIWGLAYSFELSSLTLEAMLFWVKIEYIGISFTPALWLWFCFNYTGIDKWINRRTFLLLFSIPMITFLIVLTNEYHYWHYKEVSVALDGPFPLLKITTGPWYFIHTGFFYFTLIFGYVLLIQRFKNDDQIFRKQSFLILLAGFFPWITNMLYLAGFRPFGHIDLTPFSFLFIYLIVGIGLLRFGLFDLKPLVRDKIIAAMTKGILVVDTQNRIIDFNPAILKVLGDIHKKLIGRYLEEIFEDYPIFSTINNTLKSRTLELKIAFGDTEKEYSVDFIPLHDKHAVFNGTLLQFTDISEERNTQNQLISQAEELKNLNTLKDKLFAIISHDLKGPIQGFGELIKLTEEGVVSREEFFDLIPDISKNINSVSLLLENLLAWSGSQFKGEFMDKKHFLISKSIEQQIVLFQKRSTEKGICLKFEKDRDPEVYADKNMIDIVFRNLISNAIKFSGKQSKVTISTKDLGERIQISIADTGSGISPENLSKLNHGKSFTTPGRNSETGTGLGILLVKDYVIKNGGDLAIESTLGEGSTFSFSLPKN